MKKAVKMTNVKNQTQKEQPKKAVLTLVRPAPAPQVSDPGGGCRPTGIQ